METTRLDGGTDGDPRLATLRALEIENRLSWIVSAVLLVMFGPAFFFSASYPEPVKPYIRYGGFMTLVAIQAYRVLAQRKRYRAKGSISR